MKLSFLPGDLHLIKERGGAYLVTERGQEILRTKLEKKALTTFNQRRTELESQFPPRELTPEEKAAALARSLMDHTIGEIRAESKPPKKDKIRGTRTFG